MRRNPIYDWHLSQPLILIVAASYGLISGRLFHGSNLPLAWTVFIFGYITMLVLELGLAFFLCYRTRLRRGDYRGGLHLGLASAFSITTMFLGAVALTTFGLPDGQVMFRGTLMRLRPDLVRQVPVLYACSLLIGLLSGPLYARTSPLR